MTLYGGSCIPVALGEQSELHLSRKELKVCNRAKFNPLVTTSSFTEHRCNSGRKNPLDLNAFVRVIFLLSGKSRFQITPSTDKDKKVCGRLVRYNELSEEDKVSDRDLVRGIPRILALAGYRIVKDDR
jgi:hypothetical protein